MELKEYLKESERTAAKPVDNASKSSMFDDSLDLAHSLIDLTVNGYQADLVKRSIFYREERDKLALRVIKFKDLSVARYEAIPNYARTGRENFVFSEQQINLIHAALGMFSEAGEILEEVIDSLMERRPVNEINLKEETGDVLWYLALALRSVGSDFETEAERNINKLKVRYPEKFNTEDAVNRNLEAENTALKGV